MAQFVGAAFCTHIPRLMITDPAARKAYMGDDVTTMYDAMEQIYARKLAHLDVDTFILVDTHWFSTTEYLLNANRRLQGVYTSEELPWMIHDYAYDYQGDPEMAQAIARACEAQGIRCQAVSYTSLPVHYVTLNVMHYLNPDRSRKVLPLAVCQTAEVHNDRAFGKALGEAVRAMPGDARVVFLAAGGMSHRFHRYDVIVQRAGADPSNINGEVNRQWDERILGLMLEGKHAEILALSDEYR
ncbi:MAG: DODA-type extradiol aromatic ring-opening family dioxygenase, partial [Chloroflexota bacterium]